MTDFISDEMVEAAAGVLFSTNILQCGGIDEQNNIVRAALVAAMRAAWRPIESATDLDRVFVAGIQPADGGTAAYWYIGEDFTDENSKPMDHPNALLWMPLPPPPAKEGV